jgi:futalosine hydrolase
MQVLIVAATEMEISLFHESFPEADILITGVGAAPATYHITRRLQQVDYSIVIQAGIAGTFDPAVRLGEVYVVARDRFGDLGAREKNTFSNIFELGLADSNQHPFRNGWLNNKADIIKMTGLPIVSAITINTISDVHTFYAGTIESMEGAALHYVCLQQEVPFLQLRAVSNIVGERNKENWQMQQAITSLNQTLAAIYPTLNGELWNLH